VLLNKTKKQYTAFKKNVVLWCGASSFKKRGVELIVITSSTVNRFGKLFPVKNTNELSTI